MKQGICVTVRQVLDPNVSVERRPHGSIFPSGVREQMREGELQGFGASPGAVPEICPTAIPNGDRCHRTERGLVLVVTRHLHPNPRPIGVFTGVPQPAQPECSTEFLKVKDAQSSILNRTPAFFT